MTLIFTFFGSLWGIVTNLVVALFSGLLLLVMIAIASPLLWLQLLKIQKKKDSVKKRL